MKFEHSVSFCADRDWGHVAARCEFSIETVKDEIIGWVGLALMLSSEVTVDVVGERRAMCEHNSDLAWQNILQFAWEIHPPVPEHSMSLTTYHEEQHRAVNGSYLAAEPCSPVQSLAILSGRRPLVL